MTGRIIASVLLAGWLASPPALLAAEPWKILDPGQGTVALASGTTGAAELSGITWAGRDQYYVVSDREAILYPLSVDIDKSSGKIDSASLGPAMPLAEGSDLESLVYRSSTDSVFASAEAGAHIREYSLMDGAVIRELAVPAVFGRHRVNYSLEALSADYRVTVMWTANEEAVKGDGAVSSFDRGTVVRLQKFGRSLEPVAQWAYVTDAIPGNFGRPGRDLELSGVSDLVVLPGGDLLVLERALGATLLRVRLYLVDFEGATDVSAIEALEGAEFTATSKKLLWEYRGMANLEGATLGPKLDDGDRVILLISDDGAGLPQQLHALRLTAPCDLLLGKPCPMVAESSTDEK